MRLALAQIGIEAADVEGNVERAVSAVERAAADGADLVCLPELFTVGYFAFDAYARQAEPLDGPTLSRLSALAAEHGVGLVAGSIVEDLAGSADAGFDVPSTDGRVTDGLANTAVFFDRDGHRQAVYRKRHLFGYGSREQELLVPGESLPVVDFEGFGLGITTCYDLRFPEQFRALTDRGATLVVVPSAWPYPRVEHWRTLARARAIENQSVLAAANGSGEFGDAVLLGRSTVYDPWGTPLASSDDDPALVTADVDPRRVEEVRDAFPALADRR